jgi:large conductance mechanosensitive channel
MGRELRLFTPARAARNRVESELEDTMFKGFRDFILRGNVVDLAVAVILGAAFNAIVTSLVGDVLNPIIAATIGKPDFSSVILHVGTGTIKVGNFLNAVVSFLIVASVVYLAIVVPMNAVMARMKKPEAVEPTTKSCPECLSDIPLAAKRCAHCAQLVA